MYSSAQVKRITVEPLFWSKPQQSQNLTLDSQSEPQQVQFIIQREADLEGAAWHI